MFKKKLELLKSLLATYEADTSKSLENCDFSGMGDFTISYKGFKISFSADLVEHNNTVQYGLQDMIDTLQFYVDECEYTD